MYKSVIKPIGKTYSGAALDMMTGTITQASTEPAEGDEIPNTVKVMGGEDWERWIKMLKEADMMRQQRYCHYVWTAITAGRDWVPSFLSLLRIS